MQRQGRLTQNTDYKLYQISLLVVFCLRQWSNESKPVAKPAFMHGFFVTLPVTTAQWPNDKQPIKLMRSIYSMANMGIILGLRVEVQSCEMIEF